MKRRLRSWGQPFSFTEASLTKAQEAIKKYPKGRQASAIKEILYLAQEQCGGWIPQEAVETVAAFLQLPLMRVYEVVTFYTLFQLEPVGKYHLQVCTTTPCWLRGSDEVLSMCQKAMRSAEPGIFSVAEVECLGACANAPVIQINKTYYEDLDASLTENLLDCLKQGKPVFPGSQTSHLASALEDGEKVPRKKKDSNAHKTRNKSLQH